MMMMMKSPVILVTCVLLLSTFTVVASNNAFGPDKCCFNFIPRELPKRRVVSCKETHRLCAKKAVVITMRNGSAFCANPTEQWVKNIIAAKFQS